MELRLDVTSLCAPRPSGVGVYVRHLWSALARRPDVGLQGLWNPSRLSGGKHRHLPAEVAAHSAPRWPLLSRMAAGRDGAVVHGPDFRVPDWSRIPRVVTVHDLASFHGDTMPRDFAAMIRARIEGLARLEGPLAVITPTAAVAEELADRVPALAGRVHAVHHGCDHVEAPAAPPQDGAPPYFLFVGNVEKRKNVGGLVEAFTRLAAEQKEPRLVIAGKPGFGGEGIEAELAASPAAPRVERRPWLEPGALPALYAGACALVFPTWYEGFGFPIVEAMRCGCPVITSDRGAMAEVAGDAALLVDPADPDAVAGAMERLLLDDTLHADLVGRGRRRAAAFTWDRCAAESVSAYASIAG